MRLSALSCITADFAVFIASPLAVSQVFVKSIALYSSIVPSAAKAMSSAKAKAFIPALLYCRRRGSMNRLKRLGEITAPC